MGKKNGKKGKKKQRKQPSTTNKSKASRTCWLVTSPLYKEFVELCEKKDWREKKHLPRRGSKEAKELDALMDKGLGNGQPLSRSQVKRKFEHWKKSFESEKKLRQIDNLKIETTKNILLRLKETETWTITVSNLEIDSRVEDSPVYEKVIEGWLTLVLDPLRLATIETLNELLTDDNANDGSGETLYIEKEKVNLTNFEKDFLVSFLNHDKVKPFLEREEKEGREKDIRARAKGLANYIGRRFVELMTMAVKRGGQWNEEMIKIVETTIGEFKDKQVDLSEDNLLRRTIFNITCWLVFAGKIPCMEGRNKKKYRVQVSTRKGH